MEKVAQEEIVRNANQSTNDLHQKVGEQLEGGEHQVVTAPTTSETPFPLTEELKQIGVDAASVAGSTFEEVVTGGATHVRETKSKKPLSLAWERFKKMTRFQGRKTA